MADIESGLNRFQQKPPFTSLCVRRRATPKHQYKKVLFLCHFEEKHVSSHRHKTPCIMKYPVGIQSFEDIRTSGYLYIDKTDIIYRLVESGKSFFLSRPRRFGKSLAVSTIQAYFEGRKELFEGLKIAELEKDWAVHPVLHLDLNAGKYKDNGEELNAVLNNALCNWEKLYGSDASETTLSLRFMGVIKRAYEQTGQKTVVLIDEYDKPLLQTINDEALQEEYRTMLKAFYSVLKSQDRYLRFAFLTGVTKFSKVSVFSDLNNLSDISLDAPYERLCGITNDELDSVFHSSIEELAEANDMTFSEARETLRRRYDGYHFSRKMTDIYNPFSLLSAFSKQSFGSYWFETGTPTFLVELLRKNDIPIDGIEGCEMDAMSLGNVDVLKTNPVPVLYQSGYLTIKGYDREFMIYKLGFPNEEVKDGFLKFLIPFYANIDSTEADSYIRSFIMDIRHADIDSFMQRLASFFAGYNYDLIPRHDLERHYRNVIFTVCRLIGLRVQAEYRTSAGRIDMVLETKDTVFIFEFKLNVSAKVAVKQINRKDYAAQFAADARKVYKIGVNFNSEIRGIENWVVE